MSDYPHPEKAAHSSRRAALKARTSLEHARGIDLALKPYRCGDHWHLGHSSGRGRFGRLQRQLHAASLPERSTE